MHKSIYTQKAKENLVSIRKFIAKDNEFYANKVLETTIGFINGLLAIFPNSGKQHDDDTTRQIVEPTFKYKIVYIVSNEDIKILSISKRKNT